MYKESCIPNLSLLAFIIAEISESTYTYTVFFPSSFTALALFEHVNLVYGTISEFCTQSGCADMTGPGNR